MVNSVPATLTAKTRRSSARVISTIGAAVEHGCVVDQNVDLPEASRYVCERPFDAPLIGDIQINCKASEPSSVAVRRAPSNIDIRDGNACTFASVGLCKGLTDSPSRTGDQTPIFPQAVSCNAPTHRRQTGGS